MMSPAKKSNPLLWIVPLGCFGVFLVSCGGCFILPIVGAFSMIKSNQAFAQSLERVTTDPRVVAELGEPIEMGWSISGNFNSTNGKDSADITYPISGPNGSGSVEVEATGEGGDWTFHKLVVTANEKRIDLLGEEGIVLEPDRVEAAADQGSETGSEAGAETGSDQNSDQAEQPDAGDSEPSEGSDQDGEDTDADAESQGADTPASK